MKNLQPFLDIEDQIARTVFRIYSHNALPDDVLHRVIKKKSLWEPAGTLIRHNREYKLVKIMAADGWEDAE